MQYLRLIRQAFSALAPRHGRRSDGSTGHPMHKSPSQSGGRVAIVGAGPGDPELLTLAAVRYLEEAEIVIYDRLVAPTILDLAPANATLIYVGKAKGRHTVSQAEINDLLVQSAYTGKRVVRLKGGDPFIFGRGGEEVAHLRAAGIRAEIVPGITAATGCAAAAGIPLTHRDIAHGVTMISGHGQSGISDHDWAGLVQGEQTLVVYMGLSTAGLIADALIRNGLSATTPIAVIENGTLPSQKVAAGILIDIEELIRSHQIFGPALLIIGEVARFAISPAEVSKLRLAA